MPIPARPRARSSRAWWTNSNNELLERHCQCSGARFARSTQLGIGDAACEMSAHEKSRPRAAFSCSELNDQLLAAEAGAAAEAAASGAEAGIGAGAGAGAGAATGAGAGVGASSFLPQAESATAATIEANRSDLFICVLSEKCRPITGNGSDRPPDGSPSDWRTLFRTRTQKARASLKPSRAL